MLNCRLLAAEIFSKINGATSSRSRSACYITTWQILFLFVQPFITALSALFESRSNAGEKFSVSVAIVILIVLSPWAIGIIKYLVLFSARNSGSTYSVGGHFRCHSIAVLVFYNQYPIFKCYIGVGYLPLLQPQMVASVAIDEVSVKGILVGKVGYNLP